jgi:hypothetical protein
LKLFVVEHVFANDGNAYGILIKFGNALDIIADADDASVG